MRQKCFYYSDIKHTEYEALGVYDDKGEDEHKEAYRWRRKKTKYVCLPEHEIAVFEK